MYQSKTTMPYIYFRDIILNVNLSIHSLLDIVEVADDAFILGVTENKEGAHMPIPCCLLTILWPQILFSSDIFLLYILKILMFYNIILQNTAMCAINHMKAWASHMAITFLSSIAAPIHPHVLLIWFLIGLGPLQNSYHLIHQLINHLL